MKIMRFLSKRLINMVMLLAFIAAASYQPLCVLGVIDCPPCKESTPENTGKLACKFCKQSDDIGNVTLTFHKISIQLDMVSIAYVPVDMFVFSSPEFLLQQPQAPPFVLARSLTDIIQTITPIRGPSITA